ncbi:MAG: AsmA family protein [Puniceicoccales bacterium]
MNKTSFSPQGFSILKFLLGLVALFIVVVFLFLTFGLSPTAKWAANSQLPELLGTKTTIEEVRIDLWTGDVEIVGARVSNPLPDAKEPYLFSLDRLYIDIDVTSLLEDTIVIREITIESPEVHTARDKNGKFSFEDLKIMQSSPEEPAPQEESDDSGFPKGIRVDKITVTQLAGSFSDASDPTAQTEYTLQDFNFHSEDITVNPEHAVNSLPAGIQFALIELSDALIEYKTNKDIPNPNQPVADSSSSKSKEKKSKSKKDKTQPTQTVAEASTADDSSAKPASSQSEPLYVGKFDLKNFQIRFIDTPKSTKKKKATPLDITFLDFFINAEDIEFDPDGILKKSPDEVLTARLGFKIQQQAEGVANAIFSGVAKSTVIGSGLPVTAGAVQLTGFELATIKPVLPSGVQTAIGGPAFDLYTKWFASPDKLTGEIKITSSSNVVTKIQIGGTPTHPKIHGGAALMNVVGRPGQLFGNLAGNTFKGGMDIVSGATGAAGDLAKGAGDTVLGFGKGLLNTGKGLVTGNLKEAGKGIEEATVGTVKNASNAVGKSATTAVSGVGNAYDSTTGGTSTTKWRQSNSKRHQEFEKGAEEWINNGKFPPESGAPAIKSDTETFTTTDESATQATSSSNKSKTSTVSKKKTSKAPAKKTSSPSNTTDTSSSAPESSPSETPAPESSSTESTSPESTPKG